MLEENDNIGLGGLTMSSSWWSINRELVIGIEGLIPQRSILS